MLTSLAPVDEIFQLRPLAREQKLRPRAVQAGLIEPARQLVQFANPPAQGLDRLIAHGGLERWRQLDAVSARLVQGGALWALKGQPGVLDDVFARASLHQERESHHPFGTPDRRSAFTPQRVAIETTTGDVIEALDQPRASFAGHTLETQWTTLQLAYFVGTAMWTYLTQPFTFPAGIPDEGA